MVFPVKQMEKGNTCWYPLRITYSREMKVKEYLDALDIESYIPMYYEEKIIRGIKKRLLVPVVHNLIFVKSNRYIIDDIKNNSPFASYIRYIINPTNKRPVIVPEKQMQDFIAVSSRFDEPVLFLNTEEFHMKKGDKVRIMTGIWEGVEGKFVRIKRGLRVVVAIEGVMMVATASLHPSQVEKIE